LQTRRGRRGSSSLQGREGGASPPLSVRCYRTEKRARFVNACMCFKGCFRLSMLIADFDSTNFMKCVIYNLVCFCAIWVCNSSSSSSVTSIASPACLSVKIPRIVYSSLILSHRARATFIRFPLDQSEFPITYRTTYTPTSCVKVRHRDLAPSLC
jgi:hypothetical protein